MATVVNLPRKRAEITSAFPGVRIVAALLRCTSCKHEWHGNLDPFGEVLPESARCPRCEANRTPPEAA
jgi:hypothetical protein